MKRGASIARRLHGIGAVWQILALALVLLFPGVVSGQSVPTGAGSAPGNSPSGRVALLVGVSAAKLGDFATADAALAQLRGVRERAAGGPNAYAVKAHVIREKELAAIIQAAHGQKEQAIALAKEAADVELTTEAPSGPPDPIKPALELYAELLADAGRDKDAATAFGQSLLRTPNRTPSVKGLAALSAKARQSSVAGR